MLILFFAFILPSAHAADEWCKLVRLSDGKNLTSFFGDCQTPQWGGDWGDFKKVKQEKDQIKQSQYLAEEAERQLKEPMRIERRLRLDTQCSKETGLIKDICAEILNTDETPKIKAKKVK